MRLTHIFFCQDLIIDSIYAGVIKGRMDQKRQLLEVHYTLGRDVERSTIPQLQGNSHLGTVMA